MADAIRITTIVEIRAIGTKKKLPLNTGMNPGDPTPEEIAAMCAEIRKEWGKTTERSRMVPDRPVCMDALHSLSLHGGCNDD